jgi:hypothetical protein
MSCLINSGYALGCRDNIGGIQVAYIGNFNSGQLYTLDADNNIVGLTGSSASSYFTFEQEMENGEFNQEGQYSTENGTIFFQQDLTLMFHKNDADLRNLLLVLSQANLSVIVRDQRNEYWLLGYQNGVRVVSGAMNTGKAFGDMNGVTITLQGKEPVPAHRIDDIGIFTIS